EILRAKRDGKANSAKEFEVLARGYLDGRIQDYQAAAWLMAAYIRGLDFEETTQWTRALLESGKRLPRSASDTRFWIDKHSTGGVGDKTSLLLVPLVNSVSQ